METIIIIFYKVIHIVELMFNLVKTDFFESFYTKMLGFLFVMVYYNIKEYQNGVKIIKLFDKKIA